MMYLRVFYLSLFSSNLLFKFLKLCLTTTLTDMKLFFFISSIFKLAQAI